MACPQEYGATAIRSMDGSIIYITQSVDLCPIVKRRVPRLVLLRNRHRGGGGDGRHSVPYSSDGSIPARDR